MDPKSTQIAKSEEYLIDVNELANWLRRNLPLQRAVTSHLFISIDTLRSWWMQRRNIPKQYHAPLCQMMAGNIPLTVMVSPDTIRKIQEKAVEKEFAGAQQLLSDIIERIF